MDTSQTREWRKGLERKYGLAGAEAGQAGPGRGRTGRAGPDPPLPLPTPTPPDEDCPRKPPKSTEGKHDGFVYYGQVST